MTKGKTKKAKLQKKSAPRKSAPPKKLTAAQRAERAALDSRAIRGEPKDDHVAQSGNAVVAHPTVEERKIARPDPDHPMFVDAHMNVFIHVRDGRGAAWFLTLDDGTVKVKRIVTDDPHRKSWRPYVGPSDRAAAAATYERSFLPKTAEAARTICELQGKKYVEPENVRSVSPLRNGDEVEGQ